ncbi:MAG TPA: ComEC/Rec2 family competence protein, partial [bacterium]|nr:ComEC/Rec2 family competence protein [bacterium]
RLGPFGGVTGAMQALQQLMAVVAGLLAAASGIPGWPLVLVAGFARRMDLALLTGLAHAQGIGPLWSLPVESMELPSWAAGWQSRTAAHIGQGLEYPDARLLAGMVLGRTAAGFAVREYPAWVDAGMAHLLVASGAQVTLLVMPLASLIHRADCPHGGRRWLAAAVLAQIGLVLLLTGLEPSILRAATLGAWSLGAVMAGRPVQPLAGLYRTALAWLLLDPSLLTSASFQLSYVATWGILLLMPLVERIDLGRRWGARWVSTAAGYPVGIAVASCAAQVAVLPVLWARFGELKLQGFLANLLAVPLAEGVILLGATKGLLGTVGLAAVGGWANPALRIGLGWLNGIAEGCSRMGSPEVGA